MYTRYHVYIAIALAYDGKLWLKVGYTSGEKVTKYVKGMKYRYKDLIGPKDWKSSDWVSMRSEEEARSFEYKLLHFLKSIGCVPYGNTQELFLVDVQMVTVTKALLDFAANTHGWYRFPKDRVI